MSESVAIELPRRPESAREAREQLEVFRDSLDDVLYGDLRLLVDELVVEALRVESGEDGPIEMSAEHDGHRVRVALAEGAGAYRLPSRRPEPGDPGFSLHLVQRLSDRWGMRRERDRATVWLEMLEGSERPV